jgi:hypothetical protein
MLRELHTRSVLTAYCFQQYTWNLVKQQTAIKTKETIREMQQNLGKFWRDRFSVVTPCSSRKAKRFGGTYRFHFQVEKYAKKFRFPHAFPSFLRYLLFRPEDGGDMFLRNVGPSPNYTLQLRRQ